jgi:hypothetical protein
LDKGSELLSVKFTKHKATVKLLAHLLEQMLHLLAVSVDFADLDPFANLEVISIPHWQLLRCVVLLHLHPRELPDLTRLFNY